MEEAAVEGGNWFVALIIWIIIGGIAGWLLPLIGIGAGGGFIWSIITAAIGAIIVLLVISLIKRA